MPDFKIDKAANFSLKIALILPGILFLMSCSTSPMQSSKTEEIIIPPATYTTLPAVVTSKPIFTPTISPAQTSTPVPTLIAHEWIPNDPLIAFGGSGGDGGCGFEYTLPLQFSLLSNGEVYILNWSEDLGNYQLKMAVLSRQNTCNLLNSIDQAGFFDYDPSTYINEPNWYPPIQGVGRTHISVQAWKSNSVDLYGLGAFINQENEIRQSLTECATCPELKFPNILPSIRKTYQILGNYDTPNLEIYQPARIGLWVDTDTGPENALPWPVESVKLSQVIFHQKDNESSPNIILTGLEAKAAYQLFNNNINVCGINVIEGEKTYRVFARPLLPNEYLSEAIIQSETISCSPSDGWMEIP